MKAVETSDVGRKDDKSDRSTFLKFKGSGTA